MAGATNTPALASVLATEIEQRLRQIDDNLEGAFGEAFEEVINTIDHIEYIFLDFRHELPFVGIDILVPENYDRHITTFELAPPIDETNYPSRADFQWLIRVVARLQTHFDGIYAVATHPRDLRAAAAAELHRILVIELNMLRDIVNMIQ
jgi:hypothetical protein